MSRGAVVLVADAAPATGVGHYVRSASLATELERRGWKVLASLPDDTVPWVHDEVVARGWRNIVGGAVDPLDRLLEGSAPPGPGAVLVVDSYRVDTDWLAAARVRFPGPLVVIDDVGDRHLPADLVLNQNIGAADLSLRLDPATETLLGPRFVLLRPEFATARATVRWARVPPRSVLVVMGGTDPTGSAPAVGAACAEAFPDAEVAVVAPRWPGVLPAGVRVVPRITSMAQALQVADLVVTAAGSTLWEAFCLERPVAALCVAENQRDVYRRLVATGAVLGLGEVPAVGNIARVLAAAFADGGETARRRAAVGARMIDGQGASRVATRIEALRKRWTDENR